MPLDSTADEIKGMVTKIQQAGIDLYGGGVIYMKSAEEVEKAFAYAGSCEMGHGAIDIPGFLKMLLGENYSKVVSFEYEKDGKDPLAGLAESVGYVRGILRMLS